MAGNDRFHDYLSFSIYKMAWRDHDLISSCSAMMEDVEEEAPMKSVVAHRIYFSCCPSWNLSFDFWSMNRMSSFLKWHMLLACNHRVAMLLRIRVASLRSTMTIAFELDSHFMCDVLFFMLAFIYHWVDKAIVLNKDMIHEIGLQEHESIQEFQPVLLIVMMLVMITMPLLLLHRILRSRRRIEAPSTLVSSNIQVCMEVASGNDSPSGAGGVVSMY